MRALIVDDIHPVLIKEFSRSGIETVYAPDFSRQETESIIKDFEILVIRSKFFVDEHFLKLAPKLKIIGRSGAGMDNIDEKAANEHGVILLGANEGNCDAVAEHMIGMLLFLLNHLNRSNLQIKNLQWLRNENRGHELKGKTVALIGYGHNGQAMAKKLSGFDVNVIAYDKYKKGFSDQYAKEASMEQIYREANVLSFHIPLTFETKGLVNKVYLSNFCKPLYFLMGARGQITDMQAIVHSLRSGQIIAAAFDVLPQEGFPDLAEQEWFAELCSRDNVLLSPHIAGWTHESYYKLSLIIAQKVINIVCPESKPT